MGIFSKRPQQLPLPRSQVTVPQNCSCCEHLDAVKDSAQFLTGPMPMVSTQWYQRQVKYIRNFQPVQGTRFFFMMPPSRKIYWLVYIAPWCSKCIGWVGLGWDGSLGGARHRSPTVLLASLISFLFACMTPLPGQVRFLMYNRQVQAATYFGTSLWPLWPTYIHVLV